MVCTVTKARRKFRQTNWILVEGVEQPERGFDNTHRERLVVVWTILLLRPQLGKTKFTVRTDHRAQKWNLNLEDASGDLQGRVSVTSSTIST